MLNMSRYIRGAAAESGLLNRFLPVSQRRGAGTWFSCSLPASSCKTQLSSAISDGASTLSHLSTSLFQYTHCPDLFLPLILLLITLPFLSCPLHCLKCLSRRLLFLTFHHVSAKISLLAAVICMAGFERLVPLPQNLILLTGSTAGYWQQRHIKRQNLESIQMAVAIKIPQKVGITL